VRALAATVWVTAAALALSACGGHAQPHLTVIARGLDNPRQISFATNGDLYVAQAGHGGQARCLGSGAARTCIGATGSVARLRRGVLTQVVGGLPSVASTSGQEASGPADAVVSGGRLALVVQDTDIDAQGADDFGRAGRRLGQLLSGPIGAGKLRVQANLARYEALHNPDRGSGAAATDQASIASDPYALAPYRDGYAVVDAAANDLLWVDHAGAVHLLAVFPTQSEPAPAGVTTHGAKQVVAQSVPTSVAVGRDGALYVSELTGSPFDPGYARIWRVAPGHAPSIYARGFTNISAIAFDRAGRLLVLEIDRAGLRDPQSSGELIRLDGNGHGRREVLARSGLVYPTGVAVGSDGSIYIANYGTSPRGGRGPHGQIVRLG
jgi:hypothetical protein